MYKKILHVGIAVESLDEAIKSYEKLGLTLEGTEEIPGEKVRVAFFPVGEARIELLEATSPESSIAKFIEKRGAGLHHLCLQTDDLQERMKSLKEEGFKFVGEPIDGAHGVKAAFIHPKSIHGVLVEIAEGSY